jgi:hypothetical protein
LGQSILDGVWDRLGILPKICRLEARPEEGSTDDRGLDSGQKALVVGRLMSKCQDHFLEAPKHHIADGDGVLPESG